MFKNNSENFCRRRGNLSKFCLSLQKFKKIICFIFGPRDLKFGEILLQDDPITLLKYWVRIFMLTL